MKTTNILFVCKYNRFRSRVAEAYFKKINKNKKIKVSSAGLIKGNPVSKLSAGVSEKLGINIKGKTRGLSSKLLSQQSTIIIVADDVPKETFKCGGKYLQKIIVWKIADVEGSERNVKGKREVIRKIIKKINELNRTLEKK